nr:zinc finger, CCHC-type [Tanacetum cinerariifolium]
MTTNFGKLDKFEGHDFRRWQKKMHFLLTTLKVVYMLTTLMPELMEDATVEAIRIRAKWENDDYIYRGDILNYMSDSLFNVYTNVESAKELWDSLESKYMDFEHTLKHGKDDLSLVQLGSYLRIEESLRAQENGKGKGKEVVGPSVNMMEEGEKNKNNKQNKGKKRGFKDNNGGSGFNKKPKLECWKCGKTGHIKRDCRSGNKKNNASVSGSGKGFKDQSQDQGQNLVDAIVWWIDSGATTYVCKDRCWFKRSEPVKDGYVLRMGDDHFAPVHDLNKVPDDSGSVYMSSSTVVNSSLWHARLGHVHYKRMLKMSKDDLIPAIDENTKKAVVRLPDPKKKTLGEKGIDCIFVGYAEYSKAYRFYVIEPNDYVSINTIIESKDVIFDENRFSSLPRPKDIILNSDESQRDDHSNDVPSEAPKPHKGKRVRKAKSYGSDFQLYLVEGLRDQIRSQYSYCYSIEEDSKTYNEAIQSQDNDFQKEAINDDICLIMENNTWVLSDLPPGCKPLGCKWIFKKQMKVNGTIDKFKARLVIQGFRQNERIDYFDTYALVARITTIRLLLALAAIHNLVIYQMDVKTTFLNGNLEEEVSMKKLEGFVMPSNEHKVCKLVKSLYGLKQAPKQWHQKFDEVVLSNGFLLNQSDKCVYNKFDGSGKGVIIYPYVDNRKVMVKGVAPPCGFKGQRPLQGQEAKPLAKAIVGFISLELIALSDRWRIVVLDLELLGSLVVFFGAIGGRGIGDKGPPPTSDNPPVVLINNLDVCNPLHVHNSDNSSSVLVSFKLLGILLLIVKSCVPNRIDDLNETYDKVDGSMVYNLLQNIGSVKQGGSIMANYYHRAKQIREPFPLSDHKYVKPGELVHLDLLGLYRVSSREGFKYFLTIVDDYSRAVWTYLLKTKDESLEEDSATYIGDNILSEGNIQAENPDPNIVEPSGDHSPEEGQPNVRSDSNSAIQIATNPVFHERTKHFKVDVYLVREKVQDGVINTIKVAFADQTVGLFTNGHGTTHHLKLCNQLSLVDMLGKPYREGFGSFAWRIPILVTVSKTVLRHWKLFEGFMVQLGEDPIRARRGGPRAKEEAYGDEPSIDLLRSFLNLGRAGDWLTLSSRGGANVPKALMKPVTHLENWKARASCDTIREREIKKDKAYAELEKNYNEALQDLAIKLIRSDKMGVLIARLVKASIIHGRCAAFEEVAELKKPFVLEKIAAAVEEATVTSIEAFVFKGFIKMLYVGLVSIIRVSMATIRNLVPPGAIGSGLTISIPYCEKGHADIIDVIS